MSKGKNINNVGEKGKRRESSRERRIRLTAESNLSYAKDRIAAIRQIGPICREYLELSDYQQKLQAIEEITKDDKSKVSKFAEAVTELENEVLSAELSIASESSIANELLDTRLSGMREMLRCQSRVPEPCRLEMSFLTAHLIGRSKQWDFNQSNQESIRYPNGVGIDYAKGCTQVINSHLQRAKVAI